MRLRELLQLVVIDLLGLSRHAVIRDLVTEPGKIERMTMREVSAVREIHPQDLIAVLNRGQINRHVCLRATVRLHVRMLRREQLFHAINRSLLDDVGPFTSTVITFARIAFGILVCEHGARSFEHSFTDKIFRSDQLEAICLARYFIVNRAGNDRIDFSER